MVYLTAITFIIINQVPYLFSDIARCSYSMLSERSVFELHATNSDATVRLHSDDTPITVHRTL